MSEYTYKDYLNMNMSNYSTNELEIILGELGAEYEDIMDKYANDIKAISTGDFDPYSFFGERKIKKIAKQYSGVCADISLIIDDIQEELSKRSLLNEQKKYLPNGGRAEEESVQSFIDRERIKTMSMKKNTDDEDQE